MRRSSVPWRRSRSGVGHGGSPEMLMGKDAVAPSGFQGTDVDETRLPQKGLARQSPTPAGPRQSPCWSVRTATGGVRSPARTRGIGRMSTSEDYVDDQRRDRQSRLALQEMPELPDIVVYVEALERRIVGQPLVEVRLKTPFLLRTVEPPLADLVGKVVRSVRRFGQADRHRLRRRPVRRPPSDDRRPPALEGAGAKQGEPRRPRGVRLPERDADAHRGRHEAARVAVPRARRRRGSPSSAGAASRCSTATEAEFAERLRSREPHGEAVAHRPAPVQRHRQRVLGRDPAPRAAVAGEAHRPADRRRDRDAVRGDAVDACSNGPIGSAPKRATAFPEKVTAFRPEMAVHGKFGQPCPVCGTPVQRIRYADNETNYCARCQTDGRLLADRALSRLLKQDWPRSIDEALTPRVEGRGSRAQPMRSPSTLAAQTLNPAVHAAVRISARPP